MSVTYLKDFIKVSAGFKAAVNLRKERDNLDKVAGFIPTEVSREIIMDFAKKIHPTTSDMRSRIIMGTYGTGKSHLALVLLNFFLRSVETPQLQQVVEKLDADTKDILIKYRSEVPGEYLIVDLYGSDGYISDGLVMGLKRALDKAGLSDLLPKSAFDAAIDRIEELESEYPDNYTILKKEVEKRGLTVNEIKVRLKAYERRTFDLFREIHPFFSGGAIFQFSSMIDPTAFYESVVKELRTQHGYTGIAILWDEFGLKMEEVVKDPTSREGLLLQEFAECCNSSEENQLHLYLFCHRSLKEYHDISKTANTSKYRQIEEDLRKIEGRFKLFVMKSTDLETFQLIDAVIIADENSTHWANLLNTHAPYFERISGETARLNYFFGFSADEIKEMVIYGAFPLHPMAVYSLPAISEKVAQNNRTLFTCLSEDDPGSFKRFLNKACFDSQKPCPDMYTVDMLWDYFSNDVRQHEKTYSVYRDFELLKTRLSTEDRLGLRILKAVCVFRVFNPTRFKVTGEILAHALDIPPEEEPFFNQELERLAELKNENHILMRMSSDGSFRPAVSSTTESLIEKLRKLINETPEKLSQKPVQYLKTLLPDIPGNFSCEATGYGDDYGIYRSLPIEPLSMYQLRERMHIVTKDLGSGSFQDGLIATTLCTDSKEIEEAVQIASRELAEPKYQQLIVGIPKNPVQFFDLLMEYQALAYLKNNEPSLYAEGGELHEEWLVWNEDKLGQIKESVANLFAPEKQMIDYYWQGELCQVKNSRQLKQLATKVMRHVFPYTPVVGEPTLNIDDFGGRWGYRNDFRAIVLKLLRKDAAETLWKETASAQRHIINLTLKNNCLLAQNNVGEIVIEKPDEAEHAGAAKVWETISDAIQKAKKSPVAMDRLVNRLRKPPFGLKRRCMPVFFAAVAHKELVLGNISFEYQKSKDKVERITILESDTLEKIFTTPEKYKMVYVNVSSNQKELVNGLAKIFNVSFVQSEPPMERVKKVGEEIGLWWRGLPKHAQVSEAISDEAGLVRDYIFRPLAELESDPHKVLLEDTFENVFDVNEKVSQSRVQGLIQPIKDEFENLVPRLKQRILEEYKAVFDGSDSSATTPETLSNWFNSLLEEKKNAVFNGETAILLNEIRTKDDIDEEILLQAAEKITGLELAAWADEMVLRFSGKLDSMKQNVERYEPPPEPSIKTETETVEPGYACIAMTINGKNHKRVFEPVDDINQNAQALESMLNATLDQLGRGLDEKEKMTVLFKFINQNVFGLSEA
jgi:hypothetical protein